MFTGKQPEHVQDLVSDFNEDLKVLTKKNDLQITKGVYLGDLFVQAENFQIAKNWLTKTYWQSLLDSIVFYDYLPNNLKKYLQQFFLNEQPIGKRWKKSNFYDFNNFNVVEVFALIEDAQSEIASSILLELNQLYRKQLGMGEDVLSSSNVIVIPIKKLAQSNQIIAKQRLKLLVLNVLFLIDFANGYKFDVHKFLLLNRRISENDLLINPFTKVTPLLEKRLDLQGNISLEIEKKSADLLQSKLMLIKKTNSAELLSESQVFSNFFGLKNTCHPIAEFKDSKSVEKPTRKAQKSLLRFAAITNKQRKNELQKHEDL